MLNDAFRPIVRGLVKLWLSSSRHSWDRHLVPRDSPQVHTRGTNPDRVLIVGDGAATGRGVLTHDLGLAGYLARSLTSRTNRATDVDLDVDGAMTIHSGLAALARHDLARFDVVILSFGANEALGLMSTRLWTAGLRDTFRETAARAPVSTKMFVLAIPTFGLNPHFPKALARRVDRRGRQLNAATSHFVNEQPHMVFVPESQGHAFELEGAHFYRQWAEQIADRISDNLDPKRPQIASTAQADEKERQRALQRFESINREKRLDFEQFTRKAKNIFGAEIAAVTFIRSDTQTMHAAIGTALTEISRADSFCNITIRRTGHLVIHDTTLDARYADYMLASSSHGIRFYAGYPLEDPQGHRIGALCIMDTHPQAFTDYDAAALRSLALDIQKHIYIPTTDLATPSSPN